jgi:DNA primase (bacterial type)
MPRITDEQLSKLKNDISLVRLIESAGYKLKPEGKDQVMCCPFHEDDTPSLKVSVAKNVFNCFGCGQSGTTIDWVMQTQGVSFRHACEILMGGGELDAGTKKVNSVPKLKSPLASKADNQTALNQVIDYYHESLKQTPEALSYLDSRGLNHPELIDTFKLGFANRTLGLRLPEKNRAAGKAIRSQLQEVGIIRKSGHEHFNGSIVVPVFDEYGNTVECYGRKIRNNLRKGTPKHLYLPGAHTGVFNQRSLAKSEEVILCESLIDAMTFWVHGFKNVTTSYGTGGFTGELLEAFKANKIQCVLIAYDRDQAGNDAAVELSKQLNKEGIDTFRILFPKNMDANDYALSVQPAAKALGIAIRKAEWLGNGHAPQITTGLSELEKAEKLAKEENTHPILASSSESETPPEPSAKVMPKTTKQIDAEITDHEVNISFAKRSYRIRGLAKNMSYEQLKVNVMVSLNDQYHLDTIDMYSSKARAGYIKQSAIELGVSDNTIKKDLGQILVKLEELQEQQIKAKLNPAEQPEVALSETEATEALELLKSPDLLNRITDDLTTSGIVGEDTNKLAAYLGCVSRKLDKPLAIIIQSTSAAGKSTLMDSVIALMPESDKVQYSAMTGQSLFYMGETSLKNKILAIAEEEGAHNASYALKLLQSEGKITIASTGKDETTGNMETKEYSVEGPVMLFMTTTAIDIDEELLNRCLVLTVNETRQQTEAIHQIQRQSFTLDGLKANTQKQTIIKTHQNAQSLIRPLKVVNPYADQLTFMSNKTRTRRDHMKYLNLINTIALIHQYQRTVRTYGEIQYIEVKISDIEWANKLAHKILGRTLDELPPQTRTLLEKIKQMVDKACGAESLAKADYRFTRRQIREHTEWGNTQVRVHLSRLEEMEYVLVHRGGRGQSFVYELIYDGQENQGQAFLNGLIDTDKLQYDANLAGQKEQLAGSKRPQNGAKTVGSRSDKNTPKPNNSGLKDKESTKLAENALLENKKTNGASHHAHVS